MNAPPSWGAESKEFDLAIFRRLFGYIRQQKRFFTMALVWMVIATIARSAAPPLVGRAIDDGIEKGDVAALRWSVAAFLGVWLVFLIGTQIRMRQMARGGMEIIYQLREEFYAQLLRLSMTFYAREEVGRLVSRMIGDIEVLREFLTFALVLTAQNMLSLVATVVLMLVFDWRLTLIVLLTLPPVIIFANFWRLRLRNAYMDWRVALASLNGELAENISGVRVVQSFAREDLNYERFARGNSDTTRRSNVRAVRLVYGFLPLIEVMNKAAIALVVVVGGSGLIGEKLTPGLLVTFVLYIGSLFEPIQQLAIRYNSMQAAMASAERIFGYMDMVPDLTDRPGATEMPPIRGEVRYEHVYFGYEGGDPVLKDINLLVKPGQTIAFVGPTGAGKSTMVRLLQRFYDVSDGRITIDGHDVRDVTARSLRSQMGIVLQEPFIFAGTIADNIAYGRKATDEEVIRAAQAVGLDEYIRSLPDGYQTEMQEGGVNISVGQRQLISFARAILVDPRILILDEATSSIDTQTEQIIQNALTGLLAGRTAFVIAHRLSTVIHADQIVVLDHGQIIEQGTHTELLAQRGHYYNLYMMAFEDTELPADGARVPVRSQFETE